MFCFRLVEISRAATTILEEGFDVSDEFDDTDDTDDKNNNERKGKQIRQREDGSEDDSSEGETRFQPAKVHRCENPDCDDYGRDFKYKSKKANHDQ